MRLPFGKHTVIIDADGFVISEVTQDIEQLFTVNPSFVYNAPPKPAPKSKPAKVAKKVQAIKVDAECDTIAEEPKSSRKRASSRSRRKSSSDKQD